MSDFLSRTQVNTLTLEADHNINVNSTVSATNGGVDFEATNGAIVINSGASVDTNNTVFNSKTFTNNVGASALAGNWTIYTANPANNTLGGLTPDFIQYNASKGDPLADSGNGLVYSLAPTLKVTDITNGPISKVYDGTKDIIFVDSANSIDHLNTTGLVNGDTVTYADNATGYSQKDVGSGLLVTTPGSISDFTIKNGSVPVYGYQLSGSVTKSLGAITPKALTASVVDNPTKTYNGSTDVILDANGNYNIQLSGFVGSEGATVNMPSSASYDSASASTTSGDKTVTITFGPSGFTADAGTLLTNYTLPTSATGAGTINKAPISITGLLAENKVYDGSDFATVSQHDSQAHGIISSDSSDVTVDFSGLSGTFPSKNVGNNLQVTLHGITLSGAKAGNYEIVTVPDGLTANITPKPLTIIGVSVTDHTYDGTNNATGNLVNGSAALSGGVIAGDTVNLDYNSAAGAFSQSDVGSNLTVTTSGYALTGSDKSNYSLVQPTATGNIIPKALTITFSSSNPPEKTYDGTTSITLASSNFDITGFVAGQGATLEYVQGVLASKDAASGIGLTAPIQSPDFDAQPNTKISNYTFTNSLSGTATINPVNLTGLVTNNPTKVYDGNNSATLTSSNIGLTGVVNGESITVNTANFPATVSGAYDDPNAGTHTVTAAPGLSQSNFTFSGGALASNYILPTTFSGSGTIKPKPLGTKTALNAGINHVSKVYDGTDTIALDAGDFTLTGWVSGDGGSVKSSYTTTGTFAQSDAGNNIAISAPLSITNVDADSGTDINNYAILGDTAYGSGDITPRPISVTVSGTATKVYNGTTKATLTASGFSIGSVAGNPDSGLVTGQNFTVGNISATYNSADVDNATTVTGTLTSADLIPDNPATKASNYTIANPNISASGNITPAPLHITNLFVNNKVYNTTDNATLDTANSGLGGLVSSDVGNVTLNSSGASATFSQSDVGTGLAITAGGFTLSGSTVDVDNYTLAQPTGLTANITPYTLTLAGVTAKDKYYSDNANHGLDGSYDANTKAALDTAGAAFATGPLSADAGKVSLVTTGAVGHFQTKNAVANQNVTTSGFTLSGAQAGNYTLAQPNAGTASINPTPLTANLNGTVTKAYDGTSYASVGGSSSLNLSGLAPGEQIDIKQYTSAQYGTAAAPIKDAGNNLTVTVELRKPDFKVQSGTSVTNYILPISATANIGTITPAVINLKGQRVYDSTNAVDHSDLTLSGTVLGETLTLTGSGTTSNANGDVGTYAGTNFSRGGLALGDGTGLAVNYTLVGGSDSFTITKRPLTDTITASNKIYDGNTDAVITSALQTDTGSGAGLISGDAVSLVNPTLGHFDNKNAGTGKAVTGDDQIAGADSGNYDFTPGTTTADITQRHITISAIADNKQYDATPDATVTLSGGVSTTDPIHSGPVAGDSLGYTHTDADFSQKDVGNNLTVTVTGLGLTGADSGNYIIDTTDNPGNTATTTADITPRQLNLTGTRVYDSTTTAADTLFETGGLVNGVNGEKLNLNGTGTLNSDNAGNRNVVNSDLNSPTGLELADDGGSGGLASNYTINSAEVNVTKRPLTDTIVAQDKDYDGTKVADLTSDILQTDTGTGAGLVFGDDVTLVNPDRGTFADKNAGTWTVTSLGITGTDISNYDYTPGTDTATINKAAIAITVGIFDVTKVYDGTTTITNATGASDPDPSHGKPTVISGTLFGSDSFDYSSGTFTFTDKNVGIGKTVTVTGVKVNDGNNGNNYNYTYQDNTNSAITPRPINLTGNRKYDGTNHADNGDLMMNNLVSGETLGLLGSGRVASKNVATYTEASGSIGGSQFDLNNLTLTDGTGGGLASNYTLAGGTDTFTINKAPLTITADNASKTYGDTVTFAGTEFTHNNGLITGESIDSVTLNSAGSSVAADVNGSPYKITPSSATGSNGFVASNYDITYVDGQLTVNPLAITVTATGTDKTYDGGTSATVTLGSTELINGDTVTFTGASNFYDADAGNDTLINVTGITSSSPDASNYTFNTTTTTSADITPRPITITADDASKTYGDTVVFDGSEFGITSGSLAGTENLDAVNLSSIGAPSTADVNGSGYDIVANGASGSNGFIPGNYNITYVNGTLTINKADATVTANSDTVTYNGATQSVTGFTVSGLVNGESQSVLTGLSETGGSGTDAGSYTHSFSDGTYNGNYNLTFTDGALTINKADATVTANSASEVYNDAAQSVTGFTVTGLVGSDTKADLAGLTEAGGQGTNVGNYNHSYSGSDTNYNLTFVDGQLTITPHDLTITATDGSKIYGSLYTPDGATDFGSTGLQGTDAIDSVTLNSTGAPASADAGSYDITPSSATGTSFDANNYTITYVNGTLTVNPAALTVTADNQTKTYGQQITFAGTEFTTSGADGLQNGDTIDSVTLGSAGASSTANVAGSPYDINVSNATGSNFKASNYDITYDKGALTINKANATVTANSDTVTYNGSAQNVTGFTVSGLVNGESQSVLTGLTESGGSGTDAGSYDHKYSGTDGNYNLTFVDGTLTINPAQLTISTTDVTKTYDGTTSASGTATVTSGTLYGTDSISGGNFAFTDPNMGIGNKTVTVNGVTVSDGNSGGNYTVTYADNTTSTINPASLTVTATDDTKTYDGANYSGGNGVSYSGFVNGETDSVLNTTGLVYGGDSQGARNAGSYTIKPSGITANHGNYTISYVDGGLTINPATLTLTPVTDSKVYDGTTTSNKPVTITGLVTGDNITGLTQSYDSANVQGANGSTLSVDGGYVVDDGNGGSNYTITDNGTVSGTITPVSLTITANDDSKTYDKVAYSGGNGVVYSGFVPGEDQSDLGGALTYIGDSQGAVNVKTGGYAITPGGYTSTNYSISYVDGTLTINPALLTISTTNVIKTYDGTTDADGSPLVVGGTLFSTDAIDSLDYVFDSPNAGTNNTVHVSNAVINDGNSGHNYTVTYADNTTSTINPAPLTVTATDDTKTYDGTNYSGGNGVSYSGFVNGETDSVLNTTGLIYGGTSQGARNAGSYTIKASGITANHGNYDISYVDGGLTINPATLTLTPVTDSKVYDGTTTSNKPVTITGLVTGDNITGLTQSYDSADVQGAGGSTLSVDGGYVVDDGNGGGNYTIIDTATAPGTINKATLTYVADSLTGYYQNIINDLDGHVTGFVEGENLSNATTGTLDWVTPANQNSKPGSYAINGGGLSASNYSFVQAPGNATALTLLPVPVDQATIIPPAGPQDDNWMGEVFEDQFTLPKHLSKQIYNIGLPIRSITIQESINKLAGGIYNDLLYFVDPQDFKIADYRLSTDLSRRILSEYNAMLMNVATHQQENNITFVKQSFSKAVGAFVKMASNSTVSSRSFLAFINTASSKNSNANYEVARQVKNSLTRLSKIFGDFKLLGLNKRELAYAKTTLAGKVKPDNLTTEQMLDLIEASRTIKTSEIKGSKNKG